MTWSLFGLRFGRPSSRRASAKGFRPTLELLEKRELLARLSIPTGIIRSPGQEVLVPVNLDDSEGLVAADVAISYDTTRLELVTDGPNPPVQKGTLTSDFDVFLANTNPAPSASPPIPGAIRVGLGRTAGPITGRGAGSILQINFRVRAGAVDGPAFINLMEKIDPRDGSQITTTGLEYENPPLGSQTGIAVSDVRQLEGNSGTTAFLFTVSLPSASTSQVTVQFATANGTATAGTAAPADYGATSGTLTFAPGVTRQIITVPVFGDTTVESDETFTVNLSNASSGTISRPTGTGTILNDDPAPTDASNDASDGSITVQNGAPAPTFQVTQHVATSTGFAVRFNRAVDTNVLNLYDQGGVLGPSDVTVTGPAGAVAGSIVMDADNRGFRFIATNRPPATPTTPTPSGVLTAGNYQVTLRSDAANGVRDTAGNALDGDANNTAGGNFVWNFLVPSLPPTAPQPVVLTIPDFVRGGGQPVDVPSTGASTGIPLTISRGAGVGQINFVLRFNPALLSITDFTVEPGINGTRTINVTGGTATIQVTAPAGQQLSASTTPIILGRFTATVPGNAPYASKQILDISNLAVFSSTNRLEELDSVDDDGIHVAAFLGETDGNQSYGAVDVTRLRQVILGTNSGFSAYQLADPTLIADIDNNGSLGAVDVTRLRQEILGGPSDRPEIPPLPGTPPPVTGVPDPQLTIGNVTGTRGQPVQVPITFTYNRRAGEPPQFEFLGAFLNIRFDTSRLTFVNAMAPTSGPFASAGLTPSLASGRPADQLAILIDVNNPPLIPEGGSGVMLLLNFTVNATAPDGRAAVNLVPQFSGFPQRTSINDDPAAVFPPPTDADNDPGVDGGVTIGTAATPGQLQFSAATYSVNENAGSATVTLTRTGGSDGAIAVTFASSGGTATAGVDFTATTTTVSFSAGQTVATVTIPIINDNIDESDETVNLALTGPTGGATLGTPNTAVLTIVDDDPTPGITINDVSANEGNSGTTPFVFTVSLSNPSSQPITVQFATANGTATAPSDYTATSGTLTLAAGQ
ncbi:MAG TPA: Calx-beta domain-containing protein, partial [Gemmataceae bacterium]|nr:Calx-beta domain-containing protein [Gemmataceae bacterium]